MLTYHVICIYNHESAETSIPFFSSQYDTSIKFSITLIAIRRKALSCSALHGGRHQSPTNTGAKLCIYNALSMSRFMGLVV